MWQLVVEEATFPQERGVSVPPQRKSSFWVRLFADPSWQAWAAKMPIISRFVRRDGEAIFDILAGFCHSQVIFCLVELGVFNLLRDEEQTISKIADDCGCSEDDLQLLIDGAVALGLVKSSGAYLALTRRGAAVAGAPGLQEIIRHNIVLYRDLSDPLSVIRGAKDTELSHFWPYVFGASGQAQDQNLAQRYSQLMADTQQMVSADTLEIVGGTQGSWLDIGGGSGVFIAALAAFRGKADGLAIFDLPAVENSARNFLSTHSNLEAVKFHPGSFRDDSLPKGYQNISLIRVLYDHDASTVSKLLQDIFDILPASGRIFISEPMKGEERPQRAGDIYFALYCRAMKTGTVRKPSDINALLEHAGFVDIKVYKSSRPFITTVIAARKA